MTDFEPRDSNYASRVRKMLAHTPALALVGLELRDVSPGRATLSMPFDVKLTQHTGVLHGGVTTMGLDAACGAAGLSLMDVDRTVLGVEIKVNMLAPGVGERFEFRAEVLKAGRTISVIEAKGYAFQGGVEKLFASMTCTGMAVSAG